jgi:hypothetical protein
MGAVAKFARMSVVVGAVALGALLGAMPAQAVPPAGVVSVSGGSTPGTLSVAYEVSLVDPDILNLFLLPASTNPVDCSYDAFSTAAGGTDFRSVYLGGTVSPAEVGSGQTWGGGQFTIVPGQDYVVCLSDGTNGYGSPVVGTATAVSSASSAAAPVPTFTLTSNSTDRGTCWPTVSGLSGTWVQLTAFGCAPPAGRGNATLLGWATSPDFPVNRARNQVAVDEDFNGVRMVFIPVNGYTLLSGDNTMYPIWGN